MKTLSVTFLLANALALSNLAQADPAAKPAPDANQNTVSAFRIQTHLETNRNSKKVNTTSDVIIPERSSWVTLGGVTQGVQVLARLGNATAEGVRVDYIVLDTTATPNGVISTPSVIVRYGEPAVLEESRTVDGKVEKFSLSLTAKPERISRASVKQ